MAGIYVHIPFCRKKCFYCDFYKTTAIADKQPFLQALKRETETQAAYLEGETVETIYLGGGTPSVLEIDELAALLGLFRNQFPVSPGAEITLEANPDDLTPEYLLHLRAAGFNRLSIGIQSFDDAALKKMNRRHTARQAFESVEMAAAAGFSQISIDLIFGLPGQTTTQWENNLHQALQLPANHLSAYHLTYHEGTPFYNWLKKGTLHELDEEESLRQFEILTDLTARAGFEQYEISNFARAGAYSKHNTGYWTGKKYLGLGPSAHSYNGSSRRWNIANLKQYLEKINRDECCFEQEILTEKEQLNDYLITSIRTKWGISRQFVQTRFGTAMLKTVCDSVKNYEKTGHVKTENDRILLTHQGIMISDEIMVALMVV